MAPKAKSQPKPKAKAKTKAKAKRAARFELRFLLNNRFKIVKVAADLTAAELLGMWAERNGFNIQEYPDYALVERQRGGVDVVICGDAVLSQILERRAIVFVSGLSGPI